MSSPANPIVVIPARMQSTRLPGKPLADIHGEAMIVHVWRRGMEADVGPVVVACAEPEIAEAVEAAGGRAVLTRPDACLARHGKGFEGPARGADYKGLHRYVSVDRWNPILVADHPYDLDLCDLCVRECPIKDAIVMAPMSDDPNDKRRTPKVLEACTGCGMCEMICPVEEACIEIEPRKTWGQA